MQSVRLGGGAFGFALPKKRFMAAVPRSRSRARQRRQRSRPTRNSTADPAPRREGRGKQEALCRHRSPELPAGSVVLGAAGRFSSPAHGAAFVPHHAPCSQLLGFHCLLAV